MGLVTFTGGARSGKSHAAQMMAQRCAGDVAVVVFGVADGDPEMGDRIAAHQATRPSEWSLIEARDSVEWTERTRDEVLLIDCLGTLLGTVMGEVLAEKSTTEMAGITELPEGFEAEVEKRFAALIAWIIRRMDHTVVVTNEVGDGVVPAYATGRVFRDVLGRANRSLVDNSERSYLVVAGRLIELGKLPTEGSWPWHEQGCD